MTYFTNKQLRKVEIASHIEAVCFRIVQLRASVARQKTNSGWNDAGIYNRDWKLELANTKREIEILKKAKRSFENSLIKVR
jgi:hypothetical protein